MSACSRMLKDFGQIALFFLLAAASGADGALAQTTAQAAPGAPVQRTPLPPADAGPVFRAMELQFHPVNQSVIEPETYLYYIQGRPSRPVDGVWVRYDAQTERRLLDDFRRLWNTNFLDNLWIEVNDAPYDNGVMGKHVIFHMEERERVKLVDYAGPGAEKLDRTKIDEKLREKNVTVRLDSFLDQRTIGRVQDALREMLAEKGYQFAKVTHEIRPVAGGPKLVNLTFHLDQGPKVKIRDIEFLGNQAMGDGTLRRKMKDNKETWFLSFISGRGLYKEEKFAEDAQKIIDHYRNEGYVTARIGEPQLNVLRDSADGETRWVQLQIPVTEGARYRIGDVTFDGNKIVKSDALQRMFDLEPGSYYSEKRVRKRLDKARETYGAIGYMEFVAFPDLRPRDGGGAEGGAPPGDASEDSDNGAQADKPIRAKDGAPLVDVTMRVEEGKQYFINRITFVGNTTTRDNVVRREMQLYEGGVFNTEALKFSVRRINQLGYFKNLEQEAIGVEKTPTADNKVDVTLKVEEQNRNQLTFGAGVSQFEGVFGQLSFQTANFLGRGETLSVAVQRGSRAENYQVAFTEPFLFDRPITGGIDLFKRDIQYISQFTQSSMGGNLTFGFPLATFTRMFFNYGYERVKVKEINELYCDPLMLARNPFLRDALLLGGQSCSGAAGQRTEIDPYTGLEFTTPTITGGGQRTISRISPSFIHNTVDNPIFPAAGKRYTLALDLAGLGGNTNFIKPRMEGIWFFPHTRRTSFGFRVGLDYIRPYGDTTVLPIFERLFLGGEYSVRGFDIRTIGPTDEATRLVVGGNKSVVLNAEYLITIAGPVRLVLFYDAGQVRDRGQPFAWKEPVFQQIQTAPWAPSGTDGSVSLTDTPLFTRIQVGETSAFKTSTGAEVRFFMPVLNVPFRLIFAHNPQRGNVYDNSLRPTKSFTFRFAVGSTF